MAKHLSARRRLRLRRELQTIRGAVEAARILGEAVATDQLGPERDHRRAPRALTCLLSLVDDRLREVRRAVRKGGVGLGPRHFGEIEPRRSGDIEPRHPVEVEPRRVREPRLGDGDAWSRMSPDERVLALCALRQRAGGANRGPQRAS